MTSAVISYRTIFGDALSSASDSEFSDFVLASSYRCYPARAACCQKHIACPAHMSAVYHLTVPADDVFGALQFYGYKINKNLKIMEEGILAASSKILPKPFVPSI